MRNDFDYDEIGAKLIQEAKQSMRIYSNQEQKSGFIAYTTSDFGKLSLQSLPDSKIESLLKSLDEL